VNLLKYVYCSALFIFFLPFESQGQFKSEYKNITWGEEIRASRRTTLDDLVGYDQDNLYAVQREFKYLGPSDVLLESYDSDLNQLKSIEWARTKDQVLEHMQLSGGKLWMFSSKDDGSASKGLYLNEVDRKTMIPSRKIQKIASAKGSNSFTLKRVEFIFRQSRNEEFLGIASISNFGRQKEEEQKITLTVLDKDMQIVWENDVVFPWRDYLFDVEKLRVDQEGNAYLLGLLYQGDKRKEKRKGEPNYEYHVVKFKKDKSEPEDYLIKLEKEFITDMTIDVLDNQDIVAAGFYSSKGTFSIDGTYFATVDATSKQIKRKAQKEFDLDFITQAMTERQAEKAEKKEAKGKEVELFEYDLDDIVLREDGGAVLVGEQYYMFTTVTTTTTAGGGTSTRTTDHYIYNDIFVVNLSPEGIIEWALKIPKRQHTTNDGGYYSSYTLSVTDDKMLFLFNDNPKNLIERDEGKYKNFAPGRESMVMLAEVTTNGTVEKKSLFSSNEAEVIIVPKVSEQVDDNTLVIFGKKGKAQRFMKLEF
jgi:hypothetical protein